LFWCIGDAKLGAAFLFTYGMGYATPVVAAGLFSGNIVTSLLSKSGETEWVNTALASILIFYGTYSSLDTVTKILQL
jgi:cytochrome c biogenesis protein CcdA